MTSLKSERVKHLLTFSSVTDFYKTAWEDFQVSRPNTLEKTDEVHKEFLKYLEKFKSLVLGLYFVDDAANDDGTILPTMCEGKSGKLSKKSTSTTVFSNEFEAFRTSDQNMENSTFAFESSFESEKQDKAMKDLPLNNGQAHTGKGQTDNFLDSLNPAKLKEKGHQCRICSKRFTTMHTLKRHQKIHTGEMPFKCDICRKQFKRMDHLRLHGRTHAGVNAFMCNLCRNVFASDHNLTKHQQTCSGEKLYPCTYCFKQCKGSRNLKVHIRTHKGQRPFECNMCGKKFTMKGSLNVHYQSHIGEKPHKCETCGKCFTQKGSLKEHMTSHSTEKTFSCKFCNKRLKSRRGWGRHQAKCVSTGE